MPSNWLLSISASFALVQFMYRPLRVVAEILGKPQLWLSAVLGTALRDCRCVLSDSALLQAHEALILDLEAERGEPIVRQAAWDSAGACVSVQEQGSRGVAVLATEEAARAAGLCILVGDIHDADADVHARFLVLGRPERAQISPRSSASRAVRSVRKTTLLASVLNQPAWLSNIIRVFADASVPVLGVQTRLLAPWSASPYVLACIAFWRHRSGLISSVRGVLTTCAVVVVDSVVAAVYRSPAAHADITRPPACTCTSYW